MSKLEMSPFFLLHSRLWNPEVPLSYEMNEWDQYHTLLFCQIFRIVGFVDPSLPICHRPVSISQIGGLEGKKVVGGGNLGLKKRRTSLQMYSMVQMHQFTSHITAVSPPRPLHLSAGLL